MVATYLAGCGCGAGSAPGDGGAPIDGQAELEGGPDGRAGVDAAPDAADDSQADGGSTGECPDGETFVPLRDVPHDDPVDCGERCRQVTWGGLTTFDIDGTWLALIATELGVVDLSTGDEFVATILDDSESVPGDGSGIAVASGEIFLGVADSESGEGRLYRYDLGTQCRKRLRTVDTLPTYLDSNGTFVTWMDQRWGVGQQDAFSFDLAREVEINITNAGCCVGQNRVWDETVVMQYWAGTPRTIAAVPIGGGEVRRLWDDPREQREPAIYEHRVVFTRQADWTDPPYSDIYGFDLDTEEYFVVNDDPSSQSWPDVHGDLVAWEDDRDVDEQDGLPSVYVKDLVTGEEIRVTSLPGGRPRIWDRTVYFESIVGNRVQILAFDVP